MLLKDWRKYFFCILSTNLPITALLLEYIMFHVRYANCTTTCFTEQLRCSYIQQMGSREVVSRIQHLFSKLQQKHTLCTIHTQIATNCSLTVVDTIYKKATYLVKHICIDGVQQIQLILCASLQSKMAQAIPCNHAGTLWVCMTELTSFKKSEMVQSSLHITKLLSSLFASRLFSGSPSTKRCTVPSAGFND